MYSQFFYRNIFSSQPQILCNAGWLSSVSWVVLSLNRSMSGYIVKNVHNYRRKDRMWLNNLKLSTSPHCALGPHLPHHTEEVRSWIDALHPSDIYPRTNFFAMVWWMWAKSAVWRGGQLQIIWLQCTKQNRGTSTWVETILNFECQGRLKDTHETTAKANTNLKSSACMVAVGKRSQWKCVHIFVESTRIQRKLAASSIPMIGQCLQHEQYIVLHVCG